MTIIKLNYNTPNRKQIEKQRQILKHNIVYMLEECIRVLKANADNKLKVACLIDIKNALLCRSISDLCELSHCLKVIDYYKADFINNNPQCVPIIYRRLMSAHSIQKDTKNELSLIVLKSILSYSNKTGVMFFYPDRNDLE
ncbi:hypothetical protein [Cysteiniphilum marinum]|uniref:hypothetical protein n=2 Tax=Cysteiniphilum marinum TaxID=2774191 RepID=UPI001939599B|nr:hypothetical protein [Cysteiniphilum marinum]